MPRISKSSNTPRIQSRNFIFTINNPTEKDTFDHWDYKFLVYQLESGEKETLHFQGYVMFKKMMGFTALKKLNSRAHWEVRKGTHEQAVAYCTKSDTRKDGPFQFGDPPTPGKRNDLAKLKATIESGSSLREIGSEHFGTFIKYPRGIILYKNLVTPARNFKSEVTVLYGPTNVGKTKCCSINFPDAYWVFPQVNGKWMDGYDSQKTVIIDEFYGWFPHNYMLRLLDEYPMKVETKGGIAEFVAKRIFITSNKSPEEWYPKMESSYPQLYRRLDNIYYKASREEEFIKIKGKEFSELFHAIKVETGIIEEMPKPKPIPIVISDDESSTSDLDSGELSVNDLPVIVEDSRLVEISDLDGVEVSSDESQFMDCELKNNKNPKQYKRLNLNRRNAFLLIPNQIQYDALGELLYCNEDLISEDEKEEIERVLNIRFQ